MAQSSREIYWSAILADYRRSGLTHIEFCQLRRISIHSFRDWLYRLRPGLAPSSLTAWPHVPNPFSRPRPICPPSCRSTGKAKGESQGPIPITHRRIGGLGSSLAHSPDVARGGGCRPDGPRRNPRHTHALPRWITW